MAGKDSQLVIEVDCDNLLSPYKTTREPTK